MFLAYGGVNFEYEVVVLSIHNQDTLNGKCASIRNCSINEEIYIR
jgi:DNA polymerase sigma